MADSPNIFKFWGKLDSVEAAVDAAKAGAAGAFMVAAVTAALAIASIFGFSVIPGVGALSLIDAAIFAGLGFGISRNSRVCAVLALAFYLLEQWMMVSNVSTFNGVMFVLFVVFFINGIRGTFAYHRLKHHPAAVNPPGA